ncbi:fimbrial protein [Morganella psychrotolerans]|uniref:fimbrial protein n=1 Tax=Morganella psychrotolerans TaxID=368603 RepID=UPI0039AEB92F
MILINKGHWLIPVIILFSVPSIAGCGNEYITAVVTESHVQERVEGQITAGTLLVSDILQIGNISGCDNNLPEELRLIATQPNTEMSPKFFQMINGAPAYYLNNYYAYTIKMDDSHAYTEKGMSIAAQKRNGIINLPRASVSVYAAVNNPPPLRLSSSQIGIIKNNQHETVAKLKLSANIDTIETCVINNKNIEFDFGELDFSQFTSAIGKTNIRESQTIFVQCTNEKRTKNISIILNSSSKYGSSDKGIIASNNPSIGFVLYYGDKQITENTDTYLGTMQKTFSPAITAYIYKLTRDIEPGKFSAIAEYTIKFN